MQYVLICPLNNKSGQTELYSPISHTITHLLRISNTQKCNLSIYLKHTQKQYGPRLSLPKSFRWSCIWSCISLHSLWSSSLGGNETLGHNIWETFGLPCTNMHYNSFKQDNFSLSSSTLSAHHPAQKISRGMRTTWANTTKSLHEKAWKHSRRGRKVPASLPLAEAMNEAKEGEICRENESEEMFNMLMYLKQEVQPLY